MRTCRIRSVTPAALALLLGACAGKTPEPEAPAPAAAQGPKDGDQVAYRILEDGRVVGRLHARYLASPERRQLISRIVWGAPRDDGSIIPVRTVEYATTLRGDFTPVSFKRLSSRDGRLQLVFRGGRMAKTTDLDAQEIVIEDDPDATPRVADDVASLALLLDKSGLEPGTSGRFDIREVDSGALSTPLVQVFADGQRRTVVQMPAGKATFAADGWVARFEGRGGRVYEREREPGAPPKLLPIPEPLVYQRPDLAPWRDRDVLIDVEGGQLAGTLSLPRSTAEWKSGMAPAVVFVSDLPPQNRHGHTTAIDFGTWSLLDAVAEAGFAVLRVDDRGVGSSKVPSAAVKDDLATAVDDVLAELDFLKRQPGVDPDRAFVIGHGFGARVAVEVAAERELTGLVLLAPAYRAAAAVLGEPLVRIAESDPARAERTMRLVIQGLSGNEAAQGQADPELLERYAEVAERLASYAAQDVPTRLEQVKAPIAVFQGMRDFEISWQNDAKRLVDDVNARKRRQAKLFVYELVDHHLKTESQRSTPERYLDRGRVLDPDVKRDLVGWMKEVAGSR